jgi:hypothetical protein
MRSRWSSVRIVAVAAALVLAGESATDAGGLVLLDEHWSPEIALNDVWVAEVDTEETGEPRQAVAGYFSARLENANGAPNVRFRNAASVRPADLPPNETEARLWYRTDSWDGKMALELWLYVHSAGRPVCVLTADLDGGGEDGRLIADDEWHQARGVFGRGPEYETAAGGAAPAAAFVWLRPTEGWDIPHTTYVDRIEAVVLSGPMKDRPMPVPPCRVRRTPGAQISAPGLVMFEGENAVGEPFPPASPYMPHSAREQQLLSNGAWLQSAEVPGAVAAWEFDVADGGRYALWARGFWYRGGFRWRVGEGEWQMSGPNRDIVGEVHYRDIDAEAWGQPGITVGWAPLGQVDLTAGRHTLEIECTEDALGFGFDCWVLARDAFRPTGE